MNENSYPGKPPNVRQDPLRGMGHQAGAPTLQSVKRMRNLSRALKEISRRHVGSDGFHYEGYIDPLGYVRRNANFVLAYPKLEPLKTIQEIIHFDCLPDPPDLILVHGRLVEAGTVQNRIVERAIARKLSAHFDRRFADTSFAYRPGRSPETAIIAVRRAIRSGAHWAIKTDIRHFFSSIDLKILELQLRDSVADDKLRARVFEALCPLHIHNKAGNAGEAYERRLPQGNGLSPVLSNLHLHRFDLACSRFHYFRYADDILVLGRTPEEVLKALRFIAELLLQLGLRLNWEKTVARDVYEEPLQFLGYELRGGNVYPPAEAIRRLEKQLQVRGHGDRRALQMKNFAHRFRLGPVRKLFRRLDRELHQLYPQGLTLTGLLDRNRAMKRGR